MLANRNLGGLYRLAAASSRCFATVTTNADSVTLVEVGPRDGLQNEPQQLPAKIKIEFINKLADTGLKVVEATSFVSPKWVPQMRDAEEVIQQIDRKPFVRYPCLVPNVKGLETALKCGVSEIAIFAAASEQFSQKNINCNVDESLRRFGEVMKLARQQKLWTRGYVSCVLGCPYEGPISPYAVAKVASALWDMGCLEISLGDTIGVGTPGSMKTLLQEVKRHIPKQALAVHCHDTYGQALANIVVALDEGIRIIDSSVAGLGGCPYAQGASGNVATEDVLYMLEGMGMDTGVDLDKVVDVAGWISTKLGRAPSSKVAKAYPSNSLKHFHVPG